MILLLKNDSIRNILKMSLSSIVILILSGLLLQPLQKDAWSEIKSLQREFNFSNIEKSPGQGLIIGVCGGFRNIVADITWLKVDQYWRNRESANTEAWIHTTLTIDPRPKFFWTNAARILALDMPAWEIRDKGGWTKVPQVAQDRIMEAHAWKGLKILDQALEYYPNDHSFLIDKAHIYYTRLHDIQTAAEIYLKASETENAPYYLKEIYAQLLIQLNQKQKALSYLQSIYSSVPQEFAPEIESWIDELKEEIKSEK
jgi:tetratricopeptide (TPR) repeat protein